MNERPEFPKQSIPRDRHRTKINGRSYDVYRLIHEAQTLPIAEVPVTDLFNAVADQPGWKDEDGKCITAREVCESLIKQNGEIDWVTTLHTHPSLIVHLRRIRDADYTHPILLLPGHGIVDGVHRITKAHIDGVELIPTRQFETVPESAFYRKDETK